MTLSGRRRTCQISLRIWPAGSGVFMDQHGASPHVNEISCIGQYLFEILERGHRYQSPSGSELIQCYQAIKRCLAIARPERLNPVSYSGILESDQAMLKDGLVWLCGGIGRRDCGSSFEAPTCDTFTWIRGCLLASFLFLALNKKLDEVARRMDVDGSF